VKRDLKGIVEVMGATHRARWVQVHGEESAAAALDPFLGTLARLVQIHRDRCAKAEAKFGRGLDGVGVELERTAAARDLRSALDEMGKQTIAPATSRRLVEEERHLGHGWLLEAPKTEVEALRRELRCNEIRRDLAPKDQLAAQVAYEQGGVEVKAALEDHPLGILGPDFVAERVRARAAERDPGGKALIAVLKHTEEVYGACLGAVLQALGPDPEEEPDEPPQPAA
jgi:hypothetical protein